MKKLTFLMLLCFIQTARADIQRTGFVVNNPSLQNPATGFFSALGVSATSYQVNGTSLFRSTWMAGACDGMTVIFDTGSIPANTSITYSASVFGGTQICAPTAGMIEQVNTAVTTVRIKSLSGLPSSFTIYNADALNTQGFWVEFWIK